MVMDSTTSWSDRRISLMAQDCDGGWFGQLSAWAFAGLPALEPTTRHSAPLWLAAIGASDGTPRISLSALMWDNGFRTRRAFQYHPPPPPVVIDQPPTWTPSPSQPTLPHHVDADTDTDRHACAGRLFGDGQIGDLSAWSSSQTDDGDGVPAAAIGGSYGTQAVLDNRAIYVADDAPRPNSLSGRFYFDSNGILMASGNSAICSWAGTQPGSWLSASSSIVPGTTRSGVAPLAAPGLRNAMDYSNRWRHFSRRRGGQLPASMPEMALLRRWISPLATTAWTTTSPFDPFAWRGQRIDAEPGTYFFDAYASTC
jgi:hypothetical protein